MVIWNRYWLRLAYRDLSCDIWNLYEDDSSPVFQHLWFLCLFNLDLDWLLSPDALSFKLPRTIIASPQTTLAKFLRNYLMSNVEIVELKLSSTVFLRSIINPYHKSSIYHNREAIFLLTDFNSNQFQLTNQTVKSFKCLQKRCFLHL